MPELVNKYKKEYSTLLAMATIVIWSCNSYPFRTMLHNIGTFSGMGWSYLISSIIGYTIHYLQRDTKHTKFNKASAMICAIFVTNMIFSSLMFGTSQVGDVLLQVTIINFLWVVLMNVFLVTMLKFKIKYKPTFYFGIILSVIGIVVACIGFNFSNINFTKYVVQYYYSYIFGIISAITWSLYSIFVKKYSEAVEDDHVFISMGITGIISLIISVCDPTFNNYGNIEYDFKNVGFFLYETIVVSYLAYYFWGTGSKNGNIKIISNFSLLAPVLSTTFTSLFYGLNLIGNVIYGSIILVVAIVCCKYSIEEHAAEENIEIVEINENEEHINVADMV